ncbi:FKBP-type peptidyl-prolyl cis-trans isomerase N-terminal domain-containing protein [Serratia sp. BIGb0163]|uniref:FKBP-type peptidyl-prolyl cis-trans isomerase N-terminal domain-containing protein n=1 Tax=Serratia sp. BIGb0163 TaxID=2940613 RepID=UPI002169ACBD|nr:FKBP-type peptidyl-prolyl cis-trans isomerase N-terminal domain-containing protein [Serratia sp. BIGb0163]MCS4267315.1 FKBP-type peptidyl-prolyl cis-trans isomerase [Serratia sp. BIGb0163]
MSDILAGEGDVPALLGVVPMTPDSRVSVKGDVKLAPAPVVRPLAASGADGSQLMARLKAQQLHTQQLTATIASLNAHLKTMVSETELNTQKQALEVNQKQMKALQVQLSAAMSAQKVQTNKGPELTAALNKAQADLNMSQETIASLRDQLEAQHKDNNLLMATVQTQTAMLESSQKALSDQKKPVIPATHDDIRDYAVGTSLGSDVLSLLKERAGAGVNVKPEMALAGIKDMFAGKLALTQDAIDGALKESANALARQGEKERKAHEQSGRQYMTAFAAKAGVVKDPSGFLYRIDYVGDGDIVESDTVSVVVKERLTDGTVIKDMESSGKWVSQPVNAFPPVFRRALLKMNNHGSVTLVVPPSLAYGDQGYPPKVPPGATMVYSLRIRDVNGH